MLRCDSVAPLGNPVVPDVYWMLIGSSGDSPADRSRRACDGHRGAAGDERVPVGRAQQHDVPQRGAVRPHLLDHRPVVARPEPLGRDEHRRARLLQRVRQLVRAVRRVDRDEHGADLGGRVLQQRPLRAVRRPDADPVADLHPEGEQAAGHVVHGGVELGVRPPPAGRDLDERLAVGVQAAVRSRSAPMVRSSSGGVVAPAAYEEVMRQETTWRPLLSSPRARRARARRSSCAGPSARGRRRRRCRSRAGGPGRPAARRRPGRPRRPTRCAGPAPRSRWAARLLGQLPAGDEGVDDAGGVAQRVPAAEVARERGRGRRDEVEHGEQRRVGGRLPVAAREQGGRARRRGDRGQRAHRRRRRGAATAPGAPRRPVGQLAQGPGDADLGPGARGRSPTAAGRRDGRGGCRQRAQDDARRPAGRVRQQASSPSAKCAALPTSTARSTHGPPRWTTAVGRGRERGVAADQRSVPAAGRRAPPPRAARCRRRRAACRAPAPRARGPAGPPGRPARRPAGAGPRWRAPPRPRSGGRPAGPGAAAPVTSGQPAGERRRRARARPRPSRR